MQKSRESEEADLEMMMMYALGSKQDGDVPVHFSSSFSLFIQGSSTILQLRVSDLQILFVQNFKSLNFTVLISLETLLYKRGLARDFCSTGHCGAGTMM